MTDPNLKYFITSLPALPELAAAAAEEAALAALAAAAPAAVAPAAVALAAACSAHMVQVSFDVKSVQHAGYVQLISAIQDERDVLSQSLHCNQFI